MTLEEELKQAEENADALRRKLSLETACKLTVALQEAAAAEAALIAARKTLEDASNAFCAHGEEHGYMCMNNTKVDIVKRRDLAKDILADLEAQQADMLECGIEFRIALARHSDALKAVEGPLKAANAMVSRLEQTLRLPMPRCPG